MLFPYVSECLSRKVFNRPKYTIIFTKEYVNFSYFSRKFNYYEYVAPAFAMRVEENLEFAYNKNFKIFCNKINIVQCI